MTNWLQVMVLVALLALQAGNRYRFWVVLLMVVAPVEDSLDAITVPAAAVRKLAEPCTIILVVELQTIYASNSHPRLVPPAIGVVAAFGVAPKIVSDALVELVPI